MKLLIVSGGFHNIVMQYLPKKTAVIHPQALNLQNLSDYLDGGNPLGEGILITDEAFTQKPSLDREQLTKLLEWIEVNSTPRIPVVLITRDFMKPFELGRLTQRFDHLKIIICDTVRIPAEVFQRSLEQIGQKDTVPIHNDLKTEPNIMNETPREAGQSGKKRSFFDRFLSKPESPAEPTATDRLTRDIANISRGISRVVAVTGHRGNGLTSTVVNLAHEANKRGLSSIIIDMDAEYRSMNMYFSRFHDRTNKDEQMSASLIRTLARPQDYMTTAFNISDHFWLTSLGYSFDDRKLMEQFYNSEKLVGLISVLRTKFNLVLLDMPLDLFRSFQETMIHIDVFGLCIPNNLHAVLSTARNVEVVLDREKASYFNAKSKVIVTKYNDRSRFQGSLFAPEKVNEILASGISASFHYEMKTAGVVPYSHSFDSQIETDIPVANTGAEFEKAFGQMLLRLMEGA
ncbi:hypothetical protein ACE3MQ_26670 [Paenibacillus lentus]|uniref:hypothetical protein n=1 Tax=Paenibacillus lentus TaxID=1338368 RepID=UPI003666F792